MAVNIDMIEEITISSYKIPDWLEQQVFESGGYRCVPIVSFSKTVDTLLIYEDEYLMDQDHWHNLVKTKVIGVLVVYSGHAWKFSKDTLDRLDSFECADRVRIFANGHWKDREQYKNIVSVHYNVQEHATSHHVIFQLYRMLKKRRNPSKDFVWFTVPKDDYRKKFVQELGKSEIFTNSMTSFEMSNESLHNKVNAVVDKLKTTYGASSWSNAVDSFGNGLPNLRAYENCFCEIVLETKNSGSYHITEKFYRPTAFSVPVILLGGKEMHRQLRQDGFRFYDHNNFYEKFHGADDIDIKVTLLKDFLIHVKEHRPQAMQDIAELNAEHFWHKRKNEYYDTVTSGWRKLVGKENILDRIYNDLDT